MGRYNYIVSDQRINSKGIIIETDGIMTYGFDNNPIALHNHDINQLIGHWENYKKNPNNPDEYYAELVFDDSKQSNIELERQVSKGLLKHASIAVKFINGFIDIIDGEEVVIVTECLLKEISITPLPANTGAVKLFYNDDEYVESASDINKKIKLNMNSKLIELTEKVGNLELQLQTTESKIDEIETVNTDLISQLQSKEDRIKELESELESIKKIELEQKFTNLLDNAVSEGKIVDEFKSKFISLSYDIAKEIIDSLPVKVINVTPDVKLTDNIIKTEIVDSKNYRWYELNDPKSLELMFKENKEKHDKLFKDFYGVDYK